MCDARQQEAVMGATLAFAVGDALGWPLEGRGNRVGGVKDLEPELSLKPWTRREGGKYAPHEEPMPAGVYSDDTQLTLAVARSVRRSDWWEHLTRVELPWWPQYQLGGGGATRRAAQSWAKGQPPWESAGSERYWQAGGNGAAMRVLAHCAIDGEDFSSIRGRVLADGATTHGHPVALVGAQAYAYALWVTLRLREPLGWGELLSDVLDGTNDWAPLDSEVVPLGWAQRQPNEYMERWEQTVERLAERLTYARNQLQHGALAVDNAVLRALGCFSPELGAGTVTTSGALYLASRHAAEPVQGLLRAAFARGADTDTLAAMTGALLGAVHGSDWLGDTANQVMDSALLRRTAEQVGIHEKSSTPHHSKSAQRAVEEKLAGVKPGSERNLPFYGGVSVIEIHDLDSRESRIRSWWIRNSEGQTFRIKLISRAKHPPWVTGTTLNNSGSQDQRPNSSHVRSGLVIRVADVAQARDFYEKVIGLPVTRETKSTIVLAGWLGLEPAAEGEIHPQTSFQQADEFRLTVVLYAAEGTFSDVSDRLTQRHIRFALDSNGYDSLIRTTDPDGIPVEIHLAKQ